MKEMEIEKKNIVQETQKLKIHQDLTASIES